jgi:transposase
VLDNPAWGIGAHTESLNASGIEADRHFVARIFRSWGWSWRKPNHIQIRKFTPENVQRYTFWVALVPFLPWQHLKFLDEAHFVSKDLYRRNVVGPRGFKLYMVQTAELNLSYSLTLLTDPSNPNNPFFFSVRISSNTEVDFLNFLMDAIEAGRLVEDDILVVDNATVHSGLSTWEMMQQLLSAFGIQLLYLPAYSPELNPCELVFAWTKNFIRQRRTAGQQLWEVMLVSLARLSYDTLLRYYAHCTDFVLRI